MMKCSALIYCYSLFVSVTACVNNKRLISSRRPHLAALVLARGGSKGIPLKNLAKVNGVSLITRTASVISGTDGFDSVWISTDSDAILQEVNKVVSNIHWRSTESAEDSASSLLGVQEFLTAHAEVDVIGLIQCTSPFIGARYLQEAIQHIRKGRDCVFSVTRSFSLRWKEVRDGNLVSLNFDPRSRPRRQDWNGELVENGMFYFATAKLISQGLFQNDRCGVVEVDKRDSLEIDTPYDLDVANSIYHLSSSEE